MAKRIDVYISTKQSKPDNEHFKEGFVYFGMQSDRADKWAVDNIDFEDRHWTGHNLIAKEEDAPALMERMKAVGFKFT